MKLKTAIGSPLFMEGADRYSKLLGASLDSFIFECVCGNEYKLSFKYDIYRLSQLRCPKCKRNIKADVGERAVYKRVKSDASRMGRTFNLPFDWFKHAIHAPCHYCGRTDRNSINVASKRPGEWLIQNFRYNGIDRLNNDVGYEVQNCVPCCFICNRAKQSMPYSEFIDWIDSMIEYRGKPNRS